MLLCEVFLSSHPDPFRVKCLQVISLQAFFYTGGGGGQDSETHGFKNAPNPYFLVLCRFGYLNRLVNVAAVFESLTNPSETHNYH